MLNRKSVWGLADQALSSATNVALTIVVAREVGTADLGAFGVAYAAYLILVGLSRAVSSEPLLVRHAQGGARESTGIALACGVVTGALLYGAAVVLGGRAEPALPRGESQADGFRCAKPRVPGAVWGISGESRGDQAI